MQDKTADESALIVKHLNDNLWSYKQLARLVAQFLSWRVHERFAGSRLPVLHLYQHRAKSVPSLRKNLSTEGRYSSKTISNITDLAGCRIIFYFRDDLDAFCSDTRRFGEWFGQRSEDEFRRIVGSKGLDGLRKTPGYDSYHFVLKVTKETVFWRSLQELDRKHLTGLCCEVQLRTILRHAWAEAEHDLRYKIQSTANIPIREEQERVFSKTASDIEAADDSFILVKKELGHIYEHLFPADGHTPRGWTYSAPGSSSAHEFNGVRYHYEALHLFRDGIPRPTVVQLADIFNIDRSVEHAVGVREYKQGMWKLLEDQESEFLSSIQWDSLVVRACNWDSATATVTVQPAYYSDQVVTNHKKALTKTIPGTNRKVSSLAYDATQRLLPFAKSPMSNTLGVACVIRVERDYWIVAHRSSSVAFDPGMLGCPASGALEWTELGHWIERDFMGWFVGGMARECEEEIGYKANTKDFVYLGFAREMGRAGKPQLFFLLDLGSQPAKSIVSMWSTYTPPRSADPSARTEFQELKVLSTQQVAALVCADDKRVATVTSGLGLSEELRMNLVLALEHLNTTDRLDSQGV